MFGRKRAVVGVALVITLVAVVGVGLAVATTGSPTIYACAQKEDGGLRAVAEPGACRPSEYPLEWNTQGPPGPAGSADLEIYDVEQIADVPDLPRVTYDVFCRVGDAALSGSFRMESDPDVYPGVNPGVQTLVDGRTTAETSEGTREGWIVRLRSLEATGFRESFTLTLAVRCLDRTP